ncbi:MAG: ABC transporter permease [Rhodovibrionaceae bacterium]
MVAIDETESSGSAKPRRAGFPRTRLLILPAALLLIFITVCPLLLMGYISVLERDYSGSVVWGQFSFEAYIRFLFERNLDDSLSLNFDYLSIFGRSFSLSAMTMLLSVLLGFPTALYIATRPAHLRNLFVFLVTVPFWTNLLVRNYSWILLLRDHGMINSLLLWLGVIDQPLQMMNSNFAVAVGLTYSFLPFMVLPIYASLEKIDLRLIEASFDLYANRYHAMRRVVIPLAKPGIIAGSILVFVPCLGSYVTPELLGGGKTMMIGNLIGLQFGAARNWPFGAALGLGLLAIVLIAMTIYAVRIRPAEEGRR